MSTDRRTLRRGELMTKRQKRQFDAAFNAAIDAAIAAARREVIAGTKRRLDAAIAIALRAALAGTARKLARIQGALSGAMGIKYVWIQRSIVPRHSVRRHQRLVFYKRAENP